MADFYQIPGELNITVGLGDDLVLNLDFDVNLNGFVFNANSVSEFDGTETLWSYSGTNLTAGQIQLSLTESQIDNLGVAVHKWYLMGASGTFSRRYLAGDFEVKAYP